MGRALQLPYVHITMGLAWSLGTLGASMAWLWSPTPGQSGALLNPGLLEGFRHGRSQPRGLLMVHQPGPCTDDGEQLRQLTAKEKGTLG